LPFTGRNRTCPCLKAQGLKPSCGKTVPEEVP